MLHVRRPVLLGIACLLSAPGLVADTAGPDDGIPEGWLQTATEQILRSEYRFSATPEGGWTAPNRSQNLRTRFDVGGLKLTSRIAGDDESQGGWSLDLVLARFGREGTLELVDSVHPLADENRLEFRREQLTEWYVNDERGLEQGFNLDIPPAGDDDRFVVLEMELSSGMRAYPAEDMQAVVFRASGGADVLRYAGLAVWDALNHELPARLEVGVGRLSIVVDDRDAVYPITVDPLITTPDTQLEMDTYDNFFGASVATAGDVNGDGYSDVIVGAPNYEFLPFGGRAYLFYGSASGLSTTPAWESSGFPDQLGQFGASVSTAGDVNGDGFDDIIIGQPYWGVNGPPGRVYVYYGASTVPNGLPDHDYVGTSNMRVGTSVSWAGDVNGDGYDDVIVGAPGFVASHGYVIVFLGSSTGLSDDTSVWGADWFAECPDSPCDLGQSVGTAGDVNGDGYDDVIAGAPLRGTVSSEAGNAFIWFGGPSGLGVDGTPANADWSYVGASPFDQLGSRVGTAGDVNGDGYADVFAASGEHDALDDRIVYVFHGSSSGPGGPDWQASAALGADFGWSVSTAGDVNGDGCADLMIGARLHDNGNTDEGAAYLWYGAPWGLGPDGTPANAGWKVESNADMGYTGWSVATAGDVNGDGHSDLIVGSPGLVNGEAGEGLAHVYHGAAFGLSNSAKWAAQSDEPAAQLGFSVASAGDINADGYSDVIVGAPLFDNGQLEEGRAIVYMGSASGIPFTPSWTAESNQKFSRFGHSVASAGDVDGNGYSDVIVGANLYYNGENDEGAAFVWFGGTSGLGTPGTPANADWSADGNQASGWFGYSVASAGDVNGDGLGDLIVGQPYYDDVSSNEGRAQLFLGSKTGPSPTANWNGVGSSFGLFGLTVATAGDVNGDGFSDIIVAAPLASNGQTFEGRAFVYRGSSSGPSASADWTAECDVMSCELGFALASGDVNGDGYSDVILGAPGYTHGETTEGGLFVFHGSATGLGALTGTPANADWTAESNSVLAHIIEFGASVAVTDIDGDGYGDLFAGAPANNHFTFKDGGVYCWRGSASGFGPSGTLLNADWATGANQLEANFGLSLAAAGDVNGDGFGDLIIGASTADFGPETDEGMAFAYYGNSGGGFTRLPRQWMAAADKPIHPLGRTDHDYAFRVLALGRTAAGRGQVALEWEIETVGTVFDGVGRVTGTFWDTGLPLPFEGSVEPLTELVNHAPSGTAIHWRARVVSDSPLFPSSPWLSMPHNGRNETDLRTSGFPDADGDGVQSDVDCDDGDGAIWAAPGETHDLQFTDEVTLVWSSPSPPGSDPPFQYELLFTERPDDWVNGLKCDGSSNPTATHNDDPVPGGMFFFLSRAFNACGVGPIGNRSDGTPRIVGPCP